MIEQNYPHEVEIIKKLTGASVVKETHISYAIIGDEFVYKIKKPVDFGFLDYRSAKSRRGFCILEKELNQRFSKDIYIQVLKLVKKGARDFDLVSVENTLPALEYVLKMKKIHDGDFLQTRLENGLIDKPTMVSIGKEVAQLFKNLDSAPTDDAFETFAQAVKFNAVENFTQTQKYVGGLIDGDSFDFIQKKTLQFLESHEHVMNTRFANGYVKNGHGDLRLEHIYFNPDASVGLIDCIEFNKRFRFADCVAEAAFLTMELDFTHKSEYGDWFLEGFFQIFNDEYSVKLLNYYRSYFAYVRAKVTCFLVDGKDSSWELFDTKVQEIKRLIDMAVFYCINLDGCYNMVFYGLMGTGKSKNGKIFAERFPIIKINSDEERKKMSGVPAYEKNYLQWDTGLYSFENSLNVYKALGEVVEKHNAVARPCIADASFTNPKYLDAFKQSLNNDNLFFVRFTAPDDIIIERLESRLTKDTVTDGRFEIADAQKKSAEMPKEDLLVDTSGEVAANVEKIFKICLDRL